MSRRTARIGILLAWCLVVAVALFSVAGHERTLNHGRLVLLELAPVDPRSLMQGDYMALRFAVDDQLMQAYLQAAPPRPPLPTYAHLQVDEAGRGSFVGVSDEAVPPAGGVVARIRYQGGRPSLGPNAFFFQEGTAAVFEAARWGGFRVAEDGTALLVSMHDEQLQVLGASRP